MRRMRTGRMRRLRVRTSHPNSRGPWETPPGPTMWVRPATGWWERMNAGETPRNQGRSVCRPPLSVSRRRSRGLRKNAAVERRKARRSALWTGNPVRRRDRSRRKAGQRARRSAPANFGAPLPSLGIAKGSKPTIWHDSPPGCAARQRSRTVQQNARRKKRCRRLCR